VRASGRRGGEEGEDRGTRGADQHSRVIGPVTAVGTTISVNDGRSPSRRATLTNGRFLFLLFLFFFPRRTTTLRANTFWRRVPRAVARAHARTHAPRYRYTTRVARRITGATRRLLQPGRRSRPVRGRVCHCTGTSKTAANIHSSPCFPR